MIDYTVHTIKLQDGKLYNFTKQVIRKKQNLLYMLEQVVDGRAKRGIRHQLPGVLLMLFCAVTAGATTLTDCHLFALHNRKWIKGIIPLQFGIPDPTTISRILQRTDIDSLVHAFVFWQEQVFGTNNSSIASFDGKTLNGAHGKEVIKHILSLFLHDTHRIIGQVGVTQKENEIPAFHRLLTQVESVEGMLLIGDALHTQIDTIKDILFNRADYLLFVKGNQEQLFDHLSSFFANLPFKAVTESVTYGDVQKGIRDVTTIITVSHDRELSEYLNQDGWEGIRTVGKIRKCGRRITTDGKEIEVKEIYYLLSSRQLSAGEIARHVRNHWQIENNLHWEKDWLYLEDRQTLRLGNAPQAMSFLRSMSLSIFAAMGFSSPTTAINNFNRNPSLHHRFLRITGVV